MSLSVVPFRGGFGVKDDNGQIIVSDNKQKSPFKTTESAQKKIWYLTVRNPNAKRTYADKDESPVQYMPPAQQTTDPCDMALDIAGHSPAKTCRPPIMSVEDYELVYKHYLKATERFTHDQLYLLNDLLYRYNQAWNLAEQIQKLKAQSSEYDRKTNWKYTQPTQTPATTSPTTISDDDF